MIVSPKLPGLPALEALLALGLLAQPALAWNGFGHMEVAAAAWEKLSPNVRVRAGELLKRNPMYETWTQGVAPQDRSRIAFVVASTWADHIKGDRSYTNDGPSGGNVPPKGPEAAWNIGYKDHLRHRYWHFTDIPFSPDGTPLEEPATPNIQTEIAAFRAALPRPDVSDDVKSYDLVWLIHLVGDAHQPLHATSRFTRACPHGDEGGNLVRIHCGSGCSARNLHEFWDDLPGPSSATPQAAIAAASELPLPSAEMAAIADEKEWLHEDFELAKAVVYAPPIEDGLGPYVLTQGYKASAFEIARRRIALAGARLAGLLNAAIK